MGSDPIFTKNENHYSYAAYADPEMAATFDAKRFGGPIGQLLLADQERVLAEFLGDVSGIRVLDMATGTGRAALAIARRGARVTGIDASIEMLTVARHRAEAAGLPIEFVEGDVHALAFPDRAFDAVVCLRLLMHVPDWRRALAELCRVAGKRLVFDYPALGAPRRFSPRGAGLPQLPDLTWKRTACSAAPRSPASSNATGSASRRATNSSCFQSRCTKPSDRRTRRAA